MHLFRTLIGILATAGLCGCAMDAAQRDLVAPPQFAKTWRAQDFALTNALPDLQHWWTRFEDPMLDRLIEGALAANTSISAARATLRQAYALRDISRAALSPLANVSASAQRNVVGRSSYSTYATTLNGSWEIDVFGARQSALNASDADAQSNAATLGSVQIAIAQEVALGYITLRMSQARLAIAGQSAATQTETLQIAEWRLQAGLIASTDVEQARAALEQTYALLPVLQATIEKTGNLLATLATLSSADVQSLTDNTVVVPIPTTLQDGTLGTPQDTLLQRADVRAAQFQITRALALIEQAKAQRMPVFTLGASVGANAGTPATLGDTDSRLGAISATMMLPLIDGGAARAQVRVQEAALQLARSNYQSAAATALQEVEDALTALRTDRERLVRLRNAATAATAAANMATSRYSSGLIDFQVVLETQRNQLSTQDAVAGASADIGTDQVNLFKALGGGWQAGTLEESNALAP
jgi:NodT family efflux transporter outer membrane factor (OMF) lipoprotein